MSTPIGYYLVIQKSSDKDFPWTIHGLWPQYEGGDYKHYPKCHSDGIVIQNNLITPMHKYWHSLRKFHHTDYWLWHHEWTKHGACIFQHAQQYFNMTLCLFEKIKNDPELFRHGIQHGNELWFPLDIDFNIVKTYFF